MVKLTSDYKLCKCCEFMTLKSQLSHQGLCYECAKKRMLDFFDAMWSYWHKRER